MVNPKDLAFFIINMLTCMGVRLYSTFCMRSNTVTTKSRLIDKSLLFFTEVFSLSKNHLMNVLVLASESDCCYQISHGSYYFPVAQ